jgi:hypothetical protein
MKSLARVQIPLRLLLTGTWKIQHVYEVRFA